jgi:methylated-DNA-[protein]-cysteine S-methyltransferase
MSEEAGRHVFSTALGGCELAWTARGLARVRLLGPGEGATDAVPGAALPAEIDRLSRLIVAHLAGAAVEYGAVILDETGHADADLAIWRALRDVPRGTTVTYGELADRAGRPGAARAVGSAMARNPWPIVVPCHRVLAAGGALGGFSAPGGVVTKRRLLVQEGVDLDGGMDPLPGLFD